VAIVLGLLTRAAWDHIPERGRPVRLLLVALVVAIALGKFMGF
jgi:hypothetical protein